MTVLVITLPPRARSSPGGSALPAAAVGEFGFVLSANGLSVTRQGHASVAGLPRADSLVLVLPVQDIAWHGLTLPKAPPQKLRAALGGLLEDRLLADEAEVHLALAPDARPGLPTCIAALDRAWLAAQLGALEAGGLTVDRVVPSLAPGADAAGHFFALGADADDPWLALPDADGVRCLRLAGGLARALLPADLATARRFTATPAVAAAAERWLGAPVQVLSEAEAALAAARTAWSLRQFDLAPRHRGLRALREGLKRLASPAWRPVRWGLAALVVIQLLGLNLWAWHQQRALDNKRLALTDLLKTTHPQVRAVLDAPLQMRQETEALRAAAGKAGDADLESLLALTARAWPDGAAPVDLLRYENGRLTLAAAALNPAQWQQLRERLMASGASAELVDGKLVLSRGARGTAKGSA